MTPLDALAIPLLGTSLIEASAGTGKTYTITTLYLRLLLEQHLEVGQILVVTFTNAATAELRARIRTRLCEAVAAFASGADTRCDETLAALRTHRQQAGDLDGDRTRLLGALYTFDEAAIFTIHGFCQRMLQENAFESGVAFDVELVTDQALLRDEVVCDFFVRELYAAPPAFVESVHAAHLDTQRLAALAQLVIRDPQLRVLPETAGAPPPGPGEEGTQQLLDFQRRLLSYARDELRDRRQRTNTQSFDDLLQRLNAALAGAAGATLAARIASRFPAALIDEFQDTDPVQYEIFRRVYHAGGRTLLLIADPKQAIFAFRGADVFAYIGAKRDAGQRAYTLPVNRRSTASLVRAVNALFGGARAPFVFDAVTFRPVEPAPDAVDGVRDISGPVAPLQFVFVRRTAGVRLAKNRRPPLITKEWGKSDLPRLLAAHIARLLDGQTSIDGRPLVAGDIAVLCRTNDYARRMQAALRAFGVPTALQGDDSVFESSEAEDLERVLRAMAEPGDTRALRAALVGSLMGVRATELLALDQDEPAWDAWVERFHRWHAIWAERGFMPAFRSMLDEWEVRQRLLQLQDGERRLTNVLHLGELLHTAATEGSRGPLALIEWLSQLRADDAAKIAPVRDAAQVRLESDARAVKLVTIHGSKGLEYPVVVCPQLWDAMGPDKLVHFHDPDAGDRATLDLGSANQQAHRAMARREALAEEVRLLYVALTRAQHLCVVTWGAFYDGEGSALGYILHQPPPGADGAELAERTKERLRRLDDDGLRADLERIAAQAGGAISITDLSHDVNAAYRPEVPSAAALVCRQAHRRLSTAWRASSFSGLAGTMAAPTGPAEEGVDRDDLDAAPQTLAVTPVDSGADIPVVLADLPTGTRAGQMVHELLQYLDFEDAAAPSLHQQALRVLTRYGFETQWAETLVRGIGAALDSPLDTPSGVLTLRQVARHRRLDELEFVFPVGHDAPGDLPGSGAGEATVLTSDQLANAFSHHARTPVPEAYAARIRQLGFAPLAGYLRGFIDLVFEHQNRWYVVDYKSNLLGARAADYHGGRLITAMQEHHYFLQYHLYTVAVHRYLQQRLAAYDYDRHFGGVFYLFLRGMSPERPGNGVFWDRPARPFVEALSAVFSDPRPRGLA